MIAGRTLALILATVTLSALGQLLLKSGARRLAGLDRSGFLLAALQDARVLSGLVAWAASALCWLLVLRVAPLSRVHGLTSLTYVLVLLAGVGLLGEPVRRVHAVGALLIVLGGACLLSGE